MDGTYVDKTSSTGREKFWCSPMPANTVLEEAASLVDGRRQKDYGHPSEDLGRTAGMLNALFAKKLKEPLSAQEVAVIMLCVKMSRLMATPGHRDTLVDIAGYARVYEKIEEGGE